MGRSKTVTSEEKDGVIALYLAGDETVNGIASQFDVSVKTIYRILRERGVEIGKNRKQLSYDRESGVVEAYRSGDEATKGVAERFGVSDVTVRNILRRHGVTPHKGNVRLLSEEEDRMIDLYESGLNFEQVAAECGVAKSTPIKVLRRRGIKCRPMVKRKILSEDRRRGLAQKYADGSTFQMLQKEYGVSDSVVGSCLDEFGVQARTGWGRFKTEEWADRHGRVWVFKSRWESAYAKWLDKQGYEWDYEPCKFGLRECKCYTPDFVVRVDGRIEYHEVKGWLDDRTKKRLMEFVEMYPEKVLKIVGPKQMVGLRLVGSEYATHPMADIVFRFQQKALA